MKYLFSSLVIFVLLSCGKEDEVSIRLKNVSSSTFESATYKNLNYGELAPNQYTQYEEFESSYRYGYMSAIIDGQTFELVPDDYVGEKLLESGEYTFEVDFVQNALVSKLVTD